MNKKEIIEKLEGIEKELREIKDYISQNDFGKASSPFNIVPDFCIGYTLDDLYEAFGKRKHPYAVRLKNVLKKYKINSLEEFLNLSPGELLDLENVGYGTLLQTKKALEKLKINW